MMRNSNIEATFYNKHWEEQPILVTKCHGYDINWIHAVEFVGGYELYVPPRRRFRMCKGYCEKGEKIKWLRLRGGRRGDGRTDTGGDLDLDLDLDWRMVLFVARVEWMLVLES